MNFLRLFNNKDIPYNVKQDTLFQFERLLAVISLIVAVVFNIFFGLSHAVVWANLYLYSLICVVLLILNKKSVPVRPVAIFFSLYTEIVLMPVLVFYGAETRSSVPIWYAASILMVLLILDSKDIWWLSVITLYCGTYIFNYLYKNQRYGVEIDSRILFFLGYAISFLVIAGALSVIIIRMEKNFHKAESEIKKSHEIEKNAGLAKSRFLANMSHEIRTPMNSIIGLSELVLKDDIDDAARNEVTVIKNSAYDLLEIIDDVLMYSKLDSGKMKLMNTDFRFDELLKSLIDTMSSNIKGKDIKIRIRVDNDIPKIVNGDDIRIKQILMRLIFISISLTENGRLMLSVKSQRNDDNTKVRFNCIISDTGSGLSQIDLDAIGGAYETYDSRQNSNLKGIGLKFNICRELLEMMNGSLIIRSIEGVGLESEVTFDCDITNPEPMLEVTNASEKKVLIYFTDNRTLASWKDMMEGFKIHPFYVNSFYNFDKALQAQQYDFIFIPKEKYSSVTNIIDMNNCHDNVYVISDIENSYGDFGKCRVIRHPVYALTIVDVLNGLWKKEDYVSKAENVEYDGSGSDILVVDDNAVNLKVAMGMFKQFHIEIDTAKSGEEALEKLNNKAYHIVFLDMVMPELSGEETLKRMRESGNRNMQDVPVVALTANTGGNIREEVLEKGFQEYLAKPIKQRYLTQTLLQFLPPGMLKKVRNEKDEKPVEQPVIIPSAPETVSFDKIDYKKGLEIVGGKEELYNKLINTFITEGVEKIDAIKSAFDSNDIKLFTTFVHGVKSAAAGIGAIVLSDKYKELEEFGKADKKDDINKVLDEYLNGYIQVIKALRDHLKQKGLFTGNDSVIDSLDAKAKSNEEETNLLIDELRKAIKEMDIVTCRKIFTDYENMNISGGIRLKLDKLKALFEMYDFVGLDELMVTL